MKFLLMCCIEEKKLAVGTVESVLESDVIESRHHFSAHVL